MDILEKYSNEICDFGTDKHTVHSYHEVYENILTKLSIHPNPKILEIGVCSGAFLQVMSEFIPNADIYGIDNRLWVCKYGKNNPKIHLFELDGVLPTTATVLNTKFDLIIDDASHKGPDQLKSLEVFHSSLSKNGIYIIEDISINDYPTIKTDLETLSTKLGLSMQWIDLRHIKNRYDDVMAIFHHI